MRGHSTVTHSHQRTQVNSGVRQAIEDDYRTKGSINVDELANRMFDAGHPAIKGVERDVLVAAYHQIIREEIERWLNDTDASIDHPRAPEHVLNILSDIPIAVELPTSDGNSIYRAVGGRNKPLTFGELNDAISHLEAETRRLGNTARNLVRLRQEAHTRGTTINDPVLPDLWRATLGNASPPESAAQARSVETRIGAREDVQGIGKDTAEVK